MVQITLFQIIVLLFLLFAFSRVVVRFVKKDISRMELVFWSLLWIVAVVILFMPGVTEPIARMLNIGRGIDVVVYLSIILLFYLVFRIYVKIDNMQQDMTKVVREIAIKRKK
ncbi:MAG: DUF2304 family protein [Candidatus Woesearchaeota archaeon]|nr:DUF2304 family protein [Candidatus Woesearchaeota archaeon]